MNFSVSCIIPYNGIKGGLRYKVSTGMEYLYLFGPFMGLFVLISKAGLVKYIITFENNSINSSSLMIKPLTSLRFIFALTVFLSHMATKDSNLLYMSIQRRFFSEGYIGVSFFFILSGFILSLNYKDKINEKRISLKDFWIARIAKIYPLHLLTLFIALPSTIKGAILSPMFWMFKLTMNLFLLQSFIPDKEIYFSFNSPSWAISDEVFFYVMFPFITAFYFKFSKFLHLTIGLVLLIPVAIFLMHDGLEYHFFYINPFARIVDFIIGILLYQLYESGKVKHFFSHTASATLLEFAACGSFLLFLGFHDIVPPYYRFSCYYWFPMVMIILTFSYQSGYLSRLLSNRVMVFLGEISFSFYMLHQLVLRALEVITHKFGVVPDFYLYVVIVFSISVLASYLSYRYLEVPVHNFIKSRLKKTKMVLAG